MLGLIRLPIRHINFNHLGTNSYIKMDLYKEYKDTIDHWKSLKELDNVWSLIHDDKSNSKVKEIYAMVKLVYDKGIEDPRDISKLLNLPFEIVDDLVDEYELIPDELDN